MNDQNDRNGQNNQCEEPIELRREITVEKVGGDFADSGILKRVVKEEYEQNGSIVTVTETEFAKLGCGHTGPVKATCCSCNRTFCSCVEKADEKSTCSVCGRFTCPQCRIRSFLDPGRIYCRRCSFLGWLSWLTRG